MTSNTLGDLTVLECGPRLAVGVCGRLLADLGATVTKIEPPGGDPWRRAGPFPADVPDPERSGMFAYLHRGKRSVTLDMDSATGLQVLRRLVASADLLLAGDTPAQLERTGLLYQPLAEVNPRLICTAITPFGLTGPYRDHADSELVVTALSGVGYYIPGPVESPSTQPPVLSGAHVSDFCAGLQSATATMMAVMARGLTGVGQQVDVSEQETLLDSLRMYLATYVYEGVVQSRDRSNQAVGRGPAYWQCADGYVSGIPGPAAEEHAWMNLVDSMGNPEWALAEEFLDPAYRQQHWTDIQPRIDAWAASQPKAVVADLLQKRHVTCVPVNRIDDILADEHMAVRGAFVPLGQPGLESALVPASPIRFDGSPVTASGLAPTLGQHTTDVLSQAGFTKEELLWLRQAGVV